MKECKRISQNCKTLVAQLKRPTARQQTHNKARHCEISEHWHKEQFLQTCTEGEKSDRVSGTRMASDCST